MMKMIVLMGLLLMPLAACADMGSHGPITVNGTTYDDDNWNGR